MVTAAHVDVDGRDDIADVLEDDDDEDEDEDDEDVGWCETRVCDHEDEDATVDDHDDGRRGRWGCPRAHGGRRG